MIFLLKKKSFNPLEISAWFFFFKVFAVFLLYLNLLVSYFRLKRDKPLHFHG